MYTPFRHIRDIVAKTRPIHLAFFLTRRCNSRCPFCFYRSPDDVSPVAQPELTLDEIEKVSSSLGDLLWLAFSGGEIFLREDIVEIAAAFYGNNRPAIMLFPTNGFLPDVIHERIEKIVRHCPKSIIALKLSIDGLGDAHDRLRNTPGSFQKTLETYQAVAGLADIHRNFELGVNTVFCSDNQDDMAAIIEFVRGMPAIKTHTISLIRGRAAKTPYGNVDQQKYISAIAMLEKDLKTGRAPIYGFRGARIKAAQDILQRRLIHTTMQENRRLMPCYAGRLNLVLSETGEVFPCEILPDSFGNVRDFGYDLRKVARSDRARRVNSSIRNNECHCTHECYYLTNILFNPRMYPALLNEYSKLRPR